MKVGCSVGSPGRRRPPSLYGETAVAAGAAEDLSERSRASAPEPSGRRRPRPGRAPCQDQDRAPAPVLPRGGPPRTASSRPPTTQQRPSPHAFLLTRAPARLPLGECGARRAGLFSFSISLRRTTPCGLQRRPCSRRASKFLGRRPCAALLGLVRISSLIGGQSSSSASRGRRGASFRETAASGAAGTASSQSRSLCLFRLAYTRASRWWLRLQLAGVQTGLRMPRPLLPLQHCI